MNEKIKVKIISSLEKCFLDESISQKSELKSISMFQNEKLSFQIAYTCEDYGLYPFFFKVNIEGELSGHIRLRRVKNLSSTFPAVPISMDDDYLRIKPGLYPDVIVPVTYNSRIMAAPGNLEALWVDISCEGVKSGVYPTRFGFYDENGEPLAEAEINITLFADLLPTLDIYHTEWFYADCLAEYYGVPVFSDRHFEIIENYIKCAVENEINTIMMPVFTPPLDTYIGGERLTTQLVKINITDGKYCFDFSNLRRWIDICKRNGVKYYEMPHFYTQWGAKAAPKFVAEANGREQIIFGWNTPALSDEYQEFLKVFITALTNELKNNGIFKQCIFHVSDEPNGGDYESYSKAKMKIKEYLGDAVIVDAMSHYELYTSGAVECPAVSVSLIKQFIDCGVKNMWAYYCGGDNKKVSNRFFSTPAYRNRILGIQLYKYDIKGFLHWGYNYWHNRYSYDCVNPFLETAGEYFAPSGDAFLVYPAPDGTPYESTRLKVLRDAFQDFRAMRLCERKCGRKAVLNLIDEVFGDITFTDYPKQSNLLETFRERLNYMATETREKIQFVDMPVARLSK